MSLRLVALSLLLIASVDASYMMESTAVVASSFQTRPGTLLSASKQDRWGAHVTELVMHMDGKAELKNVYKNDEKHARFTVGHIFYGTWSRTGPDNFMVTFHSQTEMYLKGRSPMTHKRNKDLSPPATLRVAVIDGSKVQLSGLQAIKLHHKSLSLNVFIASVDASYMMESTAVVASSYQRRLGTLLSASKQDRWGAHVTELVMHMDGRAELTNIYKNDEKRMVGHIFYGTWSRVGPDNFMVTFASQTELYLKGGSLMTHRIDLSPPATLLVAVIDGSKVELSGLQDIKLHHKSLSLNNRNGTAVPAPEPTSPQPTSAYSCTQRNSKSTLHRVDKCRCHESALSCGLCGGAYRKGVWPPAHCSH